jgi:hypothetical protein
VSGFLEASRHAAGLLGGESVSLSTWAEAVRRCDLLLQGSEPAVRHAAAMVPLVTGMSPDPHRMVLLPGLDRDSGLPMSREEGGQVRMVALFVTRAAGCHGPDAAIGPGGSGEAASRGAPTYEQVRGGAARLGSDCCILIRIDASSPCPIDQRNATRAAQARRRLDGSTGGHRWCGP